MTKETDLLLETVCCPNCNSSKFENFFKGTDYLHETSDIKFSAVICNNCGLKYLNPRPIPEMIYKAYPDEYLPYTTVDDNIIDDLDPINTLKFLKRVKKYPDNSELSVSKSKLKWLDNMIFSPLLHWFHGANLVPEYVNDGKILEIGCASGKRLVSLRRLGWKDIYGIELVPLAANKAKELGFNVLCGTVDEELNKYADNYFDVIIAAFVMEHLYNPFVTIRLVEKKLKPGGQLLFSTIFCDSLDFKIYGKYWPGFDFPRHMVYFNHKQLKKFLIENNFTGVEAYYHPGEIDYCRASTWRIQNNEGRLFDRVVIFLFRIKILILICLAFAWLRITSRASYICYKREK
jgi:2-polyprenyl-3-methyl-5-hydroxy-6-metoxy-1,4-benzoquinol methylase